MKQYVQSYVKLLGCMLILLMYTPMDLLAQKQPLGAASTALPNPISAELSLSITILYFDQSSHELRPGVKMALDSIARLLVRQPTLMATVTAYTDNIGKRELNISLSKHRARTVENYLKQHGVLADQITASWEGPDTKASVDTPEAVKTISRRVVVQLLPR
ncbi:OmpA family protein [Spirosoma sp. KCTC 42546]|uniref:OmpA family protein n=1 Tax=Spirosoma sp. KCTC 42546 TaxID=2520506 RepID=UPI001157B58A|nr:OmpA family protein [Spirosoma sp. KCTC 42546]QDK80755.1 OmpA family protein [Spirosoma sp. KCTC 42546]